MAPYKIDFIEFLVRAKALQFGEFTLKSGRISPYFFNSSAFNTARLIERLGYFYASALRDLDPQCTNIFGPAYKGIPLCLATAIAMGRYFELDVGYFFNRKEIKTHGDRGILVGQIPTSEDRVVMVDDVITEGTTKKESLKLVQQLTSARFTGLLIAVNRMESNAEGKDTVVEFQQDTQIPVRAIVSIEEICDYLTDREIDGKIVLSKDVAAKIDSYRQQFKAK